MDVPRTDESILSAMKNLSTFIAQFQCVYLIIFYSIVKHFSTPVFFPFVCVMPLILARWWMFYAVWKKCYLNNKIRSVWDVTAKRSFQFMLLLQLKVIGKSSWAGAENVTRKQNIGFKMKFLELIVNPLTIARALFDYRCI